MDTGESGKEGGVSIVYTADVFCDGDDCSQWTQGTTGSWIPTKTEARANAKHLENWKRHQGRDLCPGCWSVLMREITI